jgi:hypothetical protein
LEKLDKECKGQLAEIPENRRVLVTAHDAFRYFGKAYNIEVRAIQGVSTESEASVKEINALVSFITERKIKAVFVESSVPEANVKAHMEPVFPGDLIAEAAASRNHRRLLVPARGSAPRSTSACKPYGAEAVPELPPQLDLRVGNLLALDSLSGHAAKADVRFEIERRILAANASFGLECEEEVLVQRKV